MVNGLMNLPTLLSDYLIVRETLNSRLLNEILEKRALFPRDFMTHLQRFFFFHIFSADSWNSFCRKSLKRLLKSWRMSPYWQMRKSLKRLSTRNICSVKKSSIFPVRSREDNFANSRNSYVSDEADLKTLLKYLVHMLNEIWTTINFI